MENTAVKAAAKAAAEKPTRARVGLVVILFITLLVAYLDRVNISVLVADPEFLAAMGLTDRPFEIGLLTSFFVFAYGASNFFLTPFGDRMGPRKATILAMSLWIFSLLIGGIAPTFTIMLISRLFLGLGEGLHFPMQGKFVKNWFPPLERGRANAAWVTGLMVGPAVAMPFFTTVIGSFGWRESFFVLMVIGLIPIALVYFFTADYPRDSKLVNDSELTYIETALAEEKQREASSEAAQVPIREALKEVVGNGKFLLMTLYYSCLGAMMWGALAWLPSYLKMARGFSWSSMGMWASAPYAVGIIFVLLSGYLGDRYNRRAPLCMISMMGAAAGIFMGATAADNTQSAIWLSLGIGFIGLGIPAAWTLVQTFIPAHSVGIAGGFMNGVTNLFSAFVPAIIGGLIALTHTYLAGMLMLVVMGIIASCAALPLLLKKY